MSEINNNMKYVKAAELFKLISEILEQNGRAWITVTGMSMYPFLKEDRDSVELAKASINNIKKGNIVLIKRFNGVYVLHRVIIKEKNCFYMIGDAQQCVEGPLLPEQLVAVVTRINRKGRVINCDSPFLRLCVSLWMMVIPVRYRLFKLMRFLKKIVIYIPRKLFKAKF